MWLVRGKKLLVFDKAGRTPTHELSDDSFLNVSRICHVGSKVWLLGRARADGSIAVVDKTKHTIVRPTLSALIRLDSHQS